MRCKVGDLAVIQTCERSYCKPYEGYVVTVVSPSDHYAGYWNVEPILRHGSTGREIAWKDSVLRPIRDPGDDAQDESKAWLPPVPTKEHA